MVKILLTGGAGFIGSHVVETLLETDHEKMMAYFKVVEKTS